MPISDVTLVAQILFAETQDFVDDPNAPAGLGLERLRAVLAWMIFRSESGSGYAAPLVPDIGVLGSKTRFPIWQACVTAAEQPISPAQVDGRDPDVTFLCDQDPTTDANLLKAFPWLAAKPPAPAVGRHLAHHLGIGAKRAQFAIDRLAAFPLLELDGARDKVSPFFVFPPAVRMVVYTTTAIESEDRHFKRCFSGPWPGCVGHLGLAGQRTE